jgi:2-hydroxychromene-2-carboxylate isomerase
MAITIDYTTRIISIPKADLTLVQSTPFEIYELDIDAFRLELKDIEDNIVGIPFVDSHRHFTTVSVGGVTLARVVEIINGYTVTFEDGSYAVNLVGANSNIADVTNLNEVQVRSANSAGLTDLNLAAAVWDAVIANHLTAGTTGKALSDAGSAGNPWGSPVTGNTDPGTFGELVGKKLLTIAKFLGLK